MVCIKGLVIPAAWDQSGNIISLAIATDDEQEYLIDDHHRISKLKMFLRQKVVVTGTIRQTNKKKIIQVESYCRQP